MTAKLITFDASVAALFLTTEAVVATGETPDRAER
jgi:hypothetical protein